MPENPTDKASVPNIDSPNDSPTAVPIPPVKIPARIETVVIPIKERSVAQKPLFCSFATLLLTILFFGWMVKLYE